jgi:zinc protease
MMGSLLGRGTVNISKDEFNERVDYLGAYLSFSSGGWCKKFTVYSRRI